MNIKKKIALIMAGLSLVSISLTTSISYFKTSEMLSEQTIESLVDHVEEEKIIISGEIEKEHLKPDYLTSTQEVYELLANPGDEQRIDAVYDLLVKYSEGKTNLERIYLVDKDGTMLCNTDKSLIGVSLAERAYNINTIATKSAQLSETLTSKSTQTQIVVITHPIMDKQSNEILGYIGTSVYAESMASALAGEDYEGTNVNQSHIYLIDENGNYIYNPNSELVGQPVEVEEFIEIVEHVKEGHEEEHVEDAYTDVINFEDNNQKMIGSYSLVPNTQWVLVHAAALDEIEEPVKALSVFLISVGIGILGIMVVGVMFLAKQISNPIMNLSVLIDKMAKLNLKVSFIFIIEDAIVPVKS